MLNKKLTTEGIDSKLSKIITELNKGVPQKKTGFIKPPNRPFSFKTKSFRLREIDFTALSKIADHVNSNDDKLIYSESQIIRGMINYISKNLSDHLEKITFYVKTSK